MADTAPTTWQPLEPFERRVLGVLVEKNKTTNSPDTYPMTLNSLVTGSNQKSNRLPVYDLTEDDVEGALESLQGKGLTVKLVGIGRAERWRHTLYESWNVSKVELAVLAELLLRGPQSLGDLRARASRMDDIPDLDALKGHVQVLAGRGLIVLLTPIDRRGAAVTHGFHSAEELEQARATLGGGAAEPAPARATSAAPPALEARLAEAFEEIAKLKAAVARLEAKLGG